MYCQTCEADVAAEVSPDGKSLLCTTCGNEVRKSFTPSLSEEAQSARDLLARWSNEQDDDPFAESGQKPPESANDPAISPSDEKRAAKPDAEAARTDSTSQRNDQPGDEGVVWRADAAGTLKGPKFRPRSGRGPKRPLTERPRQGEADAGDLGEHSQRPRRPAESASSAKSAKKFRIDAAHTRTSAAQGVEVDAEGPTIPPPHKRPAPAMPDGHRLDGRHGIPQPHLRTDSFVTARGKRPGRFESAAGQVLAYGGVGLLTVGTALILWGYFGGPVQYAPTGWLVATVGQMLLFLGVVTLISGGMQQTTHEVGARVADLGERLGRIEETTELVLSGPHFKQSGGGSHEGAKVAHREQRDELR